MTYANLLYNWTSNQRGYCFTYYLSRRIPLFTGKLPILFVNLSIVNLCAEYFIYSIEISFEGIRRELETIHNTILQFFDERERHGGGALAYLVRQNQLCFCVHCHEYVLIAAFGRVAFPDVLLLLPNERPDFICLYAFACEVYKFTIHDLLSAFAPRNHKAEDRVTMHAGNAFDTTNACTFNQLGED